MSLGECKMHPLTNPTLRTELIEVGGVFYLKFLPNEKSGETLFKFHFAGRITAAKTSQLEHALEFSRAAD